MANHRQHIICRSKSGAVYIDMAAAPGVSDSFGTPARKMESVLPPENYSFLPWAVWGTNNLLPQQMVTDIETCGILNTIIDAGSRFGLGEGLDPVIIKRDGAKKMIDSYVDDPEILNFLEDNNANENNFGWMHDLLGLGNGICRFMLNKEKTKIVQFQRDDVSEIRFEKKDTAGRINNVYYCAEWNKISGDKDNRIFKLPLLNPANPLKDLQEKSARGVVEHAFSFRYPAWGKHYYSMPLWYAQYKWVKIAQGVPEMKAAMFSNNMRIKYMVVIYEQYWKNAYEDWDDTDDAVKETRRSQLFDEIDAWLTGGTNAYKSIFVDGEFTLDGKPQQFIDIKPIEDTTKPGELLPDSAAANSEIAFAMLFNLAIVGGNQASGLYESSQGGSNVRESILMQIIIRELERMYIRKIYKLVSRFNGWDVKYPGLEFIIPATILTTLDTGGSSKPVNTGGIANKTEKEENGPDTNSSGS